MADERFHEDIVYVKRVAKAREIAADMVRIDTTKASTPVVHSLLLGDVVLWQDAEAVLRKRRELLIERLVIFLLAAGEQIGAIT